MVLSLYMYIYRGLIHGPSLYASIGRIYEPSMPMIQCSFPSSNPCPWAREVCRWRPAPSARGLRGVYCVSCVETALPAKASMRTSYFRTLVPETTAIPRKFSWTRGSELGVRWTLWEGERIHVLKKQVAHGGCPLMQSFN